MYLYQGEKCKEGNPLTCSQGRDSCPEGVVGGWGCNCGQKHLKTQLENIKERLNKTTLRNLAFGAIHKYLVVNGWKDNWDSKDNAAMFNFIDPITGLCHRSDFAFIIQTERDQHEN